MTTLLQEAEREELRNSLVLTQESAAIQILLETCQATGEEEEEVSSRLTDLQETQSAVCCYLHQAFIEDTTMTLAKLVHFQVKPIFQIVFGFWKMNEYKYEYPIPLPLLE